MNFFPVYMGRKTPFWYFSTPPFFGSLKNRVLTKKFGKKRKTSCRFVDRTMRGILRNGNNPINYEDGGPRFVRQILTFGDAMQRENNDSPVRLQYLLALRKRKTRAFVAQLAHNRVRRRAERAACLANGLNCDESGNVYPFMTNMRTFINSAQNAVLMKGYTAARDARFKEEGIVIAPRSGARRALRRAAAALAALNLRD